MMQPLPDPPETRELSELLATLVARGEVYATRDPDGNLRFFATSNGGAEDALPARDVIRELKAQDN